MKKKRKTTAAGKRSGSRRTAQATKARAKAKPARTTKAKAPAAKTPRPKAVVAGVASAPRDSLDQFIDAAAAALALPVEPAWKPAVKANLELTLRFARLVNAFPLPDESEPAPVFVA